jgi:carbonic anhydrase
MGKNFQNMLAGYQLFRKKYAMGDASIMNSLSLKGQEPQTMVVACCDSRVDPALILQCNPGDLFVVRNVANIIPPYEKDEAHHGTSAALEFGIRYLKVKHLILLGHSQCGGMQALLDSHSSASEDDFIHDWVCLVKKDNVTLKSADDYAKLALQQSYQNALSFPWIKEKVLEKKLIIHLWFFDIKTGQIFSYSETEKAYELLDG